jgi:hypothetical protein
MLAALVFLRSYREHIFCISAGQLIVKKTERKRSGLAACMLIAGIKGVS